MKLLVLGGTLFLGRAVVESALSGGHDVTIFTRGQTAPELFPDAERLHGDRDGDLDALEGRSWDAVVDTSAYVPRVVRQSAELLRDNVEHYTFVSTVSVYGPQPGRVTEETPVRRPEDPEIEDVQNHYGELKTLSEDVVNEVFGERAAIVRPGLIVGPHDPTNRFTYWVTRVARGGDVLAPEPRDAKVQFVDVRDLGDWFVHLAENRVVGTFNATGPGEPLTMERFLESCRALCNPGARLVWVAADFLRERQVEEWQDLPLWVVDPEWSGLNDTDVSRAIAAGLAFRPLEETIGATRDWAREQGDDPLPRKFGAQVPPAGLEPEREAALLREFRAPAGPPSG